jgi:hypothetical protein
MSTHREHGCAPGVTLVLDVDGSSATVSYVWLTLSGDLVIG